MNDPIYDSMKRRNLPFNTPSKDILRKDDGTPIFRTTSAKAYYIAGVEDAAKVAVNKQNRVFSASWNNAAKDIAAAIMELIP
ncbi:hypothetical protein LCGC14_0231130 [marine sediment metagenome]|uniref:Uncharacterized protein n=1 Tax=marine sediment metagenome TaxID=412755 RepID=A0A0F9WUH8_9ZZZZ